MGRCDSANQNLSEPAKLDTPVVDGFAMFEIRGRWEMGWEFQVRKPEKALPHKNKNYLYSGNQDFYFIRNSP